MEGKTELQRNFIAEARRKELDSFQRALDIQWLNSRMEDGRMGRCLALIQREADMEKDFQERTDHAAIVNARAQKETALGIEIAKVRREEACELLRRHYLRERDPSLRELTKKLQAGYVCRDLRQQIQNNEYKRLQDKLAALPTPIGITGVSICVYKALGIEIAKVRREEACELLRRHYLRERDPSLRELTKKLQAGYVCRDLRQQIQNNEYKRLQDKAEEQHANFVLRNALYNDKEAKEREEREKMERNTRYCSELQQQLVSRQRQKQCQYEDTLIEKKMLDEIMRTIADEDKKELKQKNEQTEKMRREMVTFQKAREAWRLKQKQMVVMEERQIEQQRQAAADRSSAIIAERERKMRMKEELNQKIASKILADEAARQERENIIKQLQEQEFLEKNVQDDIAERAKHERVRTETKDALTGQMDNRKKLAQEQREREAEFRMQAEAKMAADNEKELEKERKRKENSRIYSQQLLKQIQDNARRRAKDHEIEENRAKHVWDVDKGWRNEVALERDKIVEEHVPHLLGYLQAGVVKPSDLPAVQRGAANHPDLATLDIDSLVSARRPTTHPKCNKQCRIIREY